MKNKKTVALVSALVGALAVGSVAFAGHKKDHKGANSCKGEHGCKGKKHKKDEGTHGESHEGSHEEAPSAE